MNLSSCNGCGVVFDLHKLPFDADIYREDGAVIRSKAVLNNNNMWVAFIKCPVCGSEILSEE